jgi:hypothetical protein
MPQKKCAYTKEKRKCQHPAKGDKVCPDKTRLLPVYQVNHCITPLGQPLVFFATCRKL